MAELAVRTAGYAAGLLLLSIPALCTAAPTPAPTAAPAYYKADPARLAQLEAQRCSNLNKESALIQRRMAGFNRPYDLDKLKQRQKQVDADYARYCRTASAVATR
ncbi:hypothetical protein [Jeongeupia chitinilytica]|uniref:Uncharacterized protein n=1 Tax=Jeongeupia chitinilytica TaxID=1041641 RepID=A0ABQ3H572_9NEIS|nr:hypothetical protein [Jeongeupia chitinilytica]GHD69996.1 hypothetical protein GCM10007350_37430 [Jeongeupia chitinilytica]